MILVLAALFAGPVFAAGVVVKAEQMFPGRYFVEALVPPGTTCAWQNVIPDRPGLDSLTRVRFSHPQSCQTTAQCLRVDGNAQVAVVTSLGWGRSPFMFCGVIFGGTMSDPDLELPDGE